jgi:hypothetical protein
VSGPLEAATECARDLVWELYATWVGHRVSSWRRGVSISRGLKMAVEGNEESVMGVALQWEGGGMAPCAAGSGAVDARLLCAAQLGSHCPGCWLCSGPLFCNEVPFICAKNKNKKISCPPCGSVFCFLAIDS